MREMQCLAYNTPLLLNNICFNHVKGYFWIFVNLDLILPSFGSKLLMRTTTFEIGPALSTKASAVSWETSMQWNPFGPIALHHCTSPKSACLCHWQAQMVILSLWKDPFREMKLYFSLDTVRLWWCLTKSCSQRKSCSEISREQCPHYTKPTDWIRWKDFDLTSVAIFHNVVRHFRQHDKSEAVIGNASTLRGRALTACYWRWFAANGWSSLPQYWTWVVVCISDVENRAQVEVIPRVIRRRRHAKRCHCLVTM